MSPTLADFLDLRFATQAPMPTQAFSQRLGAVLAFCAMRWKCTPSAITALGLLSSLAGSIVYATVEGVIGAITALLFYQLGYAFDCADGQLARATQQTSNYGAWLDVACDHLRNVSLTAAVTLTLAQPQHLPFEAVVLSTSLMLAGLTQSLHTSTVLRAITRETLPPPRAGMTRALITSAMDTPILLLGIVLLRDLTDVLFIYAGAMGAGYIVVSSAVALRRMRRNVP
ncbi:MAG TPA: CDP-alcohol phosphatidyltransferase family protein [Verrucomicrobiae bacterium]|nr:CDP-alcohol phosphatidyltransferase family protein [Verrucomicrobiae bacterium]